MRVTRTTPVRAAGLALTLALARAAFPAAQASQAPPTTPAQADARNVEVDPIRCWTRLSTAAVRMGEPFTFTLTCAVLETDAVQVVPDESRLGPTVVQMTPFEVLPGGTHPLDLRSGSRRFFQYSYPLRLISPDAIGTDVPLPVLQIAYRINSRVAANTATQGRELTYVLPTQYVRILSMVPNDAADIRDTRDAGFGRIEAVAFRAGVLEIAAATLAALGVLMAVFAVASLLRRAAKVKGPRDRLLGRPALLRLAVRELTSAQRDGTTQGWTPAVVSRAAAAFRIAAAGALDKPINQRWLEPDTQVDESLFVAGRFPQRLLRSGKRITVSSAVTSIDVAQAKARLAGRSVSSPELFDEMESTLAAMASAQFGSAATGGGARDTVDVAVTKALELARQIKSTHSWPWTWLRRLTSRTSPSQA